VADFATGPDLLARCRQESQEPTLGDVTTDAVWYSYLTDSQRKVHRIWDACVPHLLVSDPTAITSSDGGFTYALPSNMPVYGRFTVRHGRSGPLLAIGEEFSNSADLVLEGTKLRIPNGRARTFSNGLYLRCVLEAPVIDASTDPIILPVSARILIVYDAVATWCTTIGQKNPLPFRDLFQRTLWGDPQVVGDGGLMGALRTAALGQFSDPDLVNGGGTIWWRSVR